MPTIFRRGGIFFPVYRSNPKYKITITKGADVYTIADSGSNNNSLFGGKITRVSTDGLSSFLFSFPSLERQYVSPAGRGCLFEEDDIVDVWATYSNSPINSVTDHIFKGYIDNAYLSMQDAPSVEIEGRDFPNFAGDETVIKSWTTSNILDVFIDRTEATGTVDAQGNYEDGLLYNTGLIFQFYDNVSANAWVIVKDLSAPDFSTLKTNFSATFTDSFENQKHVSIAKEVALKTSMGFYIYFDKSTEVWYFRLFPKGVIENLGESVVMNTNWLNGPSRFGVNNDDSVKDAVIYGRTTSNMPLIRSSRDTTYTGLRVKRKSFQESSLDTMPLVQEKAESILSQFQTAPLIMDNVTSLGLLTLKPGEKISMSNSEIGVTGKFIIPHFDLVFNNDGTLDCDLNIETIPESLGKQQKERIDAEKAITPFANLSGMNACIFFDFRTGEDQFYTLSGMEVSNEFLVLSNPTVAGRSEER